MFDYSELRVLLEEAEKANGVVKEAIGLTRFQLLERIQGKVAFNMPEIDALIDCLGIPDNEISRVFFKVV